MPLKLKLISRCKFINPMLRHIIFISVENSPNEMKSSRSFSLSNESVSYGTPQTVHTVWNSREISGKYLLPNVPPISTCELEVDTTTQHILNHRNYKGKTQY